MFLFVPSVFFVDRFLFFSVDHQSDFIPMLVVESAP